MLLVLLILVIEEGWVIVLLHVLLRRLVDIHVCHLVSGLLSSSFFCLFSLLFGLLDFLELLKDILVMQKRVRELIHEHVASQETLNTALNNGHLQQLVDSGSLGWVTLKHHCDDVRNGWAEVGRERRIVTLDNLLGQLMERASIERWL